MEHLVMTASHASRIFGMANFKRAKITLDFNETIAQIVSY